jgi:hypothetical protein
VDDDAFLKEFETGTWPLADWHHKQHIKVAYLYLRRYGFDEAMDRLRDRIKAYNATHNLPDLPTSGYHETMTGAWLRLVYFTLCDRGPADTADAFYEANPQLWQKAVLRFFYTPERFMSRQAKIEYLEADVTPLPRSREERETVD